MKQKLILALVGISLMGCAVKNAQPDKIFVEDSSYLKHVSVQDTVRESDAFKLVTVSGETYEDTDLFYRVVWFDKDGMKQNSILSNSNQAIVRRNQPFYWTVVAPSVRAVDYKVYISNRPIEQ
jgi:uncharacterized protein YcfL